MDHIFEWIIVVPLFILLVFILVLIDQFNELKRFGSLSEYQKVKWNVNITTLMVLAYPFVFFWIKTDLTVYFYAFGVVAYFMYLHYRKFLWFIPLVILLCMASYLHYEVLHSREGGEGALIASALLFFMGLAIQVVSLWIALVVSNYLSIRKLKIMVSQLERL